MNAPEDGAEQREQPAEPIVRAGTHLPALDGMRGLAIVLVLVFHAGVISDNRTFYRIASYGWAGVDLFFVLSGFLITGILLDTRNQKHALRHFYARRFLRILPLYYGFLLLFFFTPVGAYIATSPAFQDQAREQQEWFWLHAQNWRIVWTESWSFPPLNHFWSLAIEEQFYLFWPLIVLRAGPRRLPVIAASVLVFGLAARIWFVVEKESPAAIYATTFLRLDGFMTGALAAWIARLQINRTKLACWSGGVLLASGIPLWRLMRSQLVPSCLDPGIQKTGFTLIAIFFAALILLVVAMPKSPPTLVFKWSPLRFLGKYSYAIYVFHFPIFFLLLTRVTQNDYPRFMQAFASEHPRLMNLMVMASASILLALVSWHLLEKRFLRLKKHFESNPVAATRTPRPPGAARQAAAQATNGDRAIFVRVPRRLLSWLRSPRASRK